MENKNVSLKSGRKENKSRRSTPGITQSVSATRSFSENENNKDTLNKVFEDLLKDIYTAELELVDALPKVMEAAYEEDFEDAVRDHLEETKRQVKRLERIFSQLRIDKEDAEISEPISSLIGETTKIINQFESSPVRDSALIICAQKIEHYEIATYGSLRTLADVMGMEQIGDVLDRSLEEEKTTDEMLTELAEEINDLALEYSEGREYEQQSWTSGRE